MRGFFVIVYTVALLLAMAGTLVATPVSQSCSYARQAAGVLHRGNLEPVAVADDADGFGQCLLTGIETRETIDGATYIVYGKLFIVNPTENTYSLFLPDVSLALDDVKSSRMYIDAYWDDVRDFAPVNLSAHSTQQHQVYWTFDRPVGLSGEVTLVIPLVGR